MKEYFDVINSHGVSWIMEFDCIDWEEGRWPQYLPIIAGYQIIATSWGEICTVYLPPVEVVKIRERQKGIYYERVNGEFERMKEPILNFLHDIWIYQGNVSAFCELLIYSLERDIFPDRIKDKPQPEPVNYMGKGIIDFRLGYLRVLSEEEGHNQPNNISKIYHQIISNGNRDYSRTRNSRLKPVFHPDKEFIQVEALSKLHAWIFNTLSRNLIFLKREGEEIMIQVDNLDGFWKKSAVVDNLTIEGITLDLKLYNNNIGGGLKWLEYLRGCFIIFVPKFEESEIYKFINGRINSLWRIHNANKKNGEKGQTDAPKKEKPSHRAIAMKYVFLNMQDSKNNITKTNANEIAAKYGYDSNTSGQKLESVFRLGVESEEQRINHKHSIRDLEWVVSELADCPSIQKKAQTELKLARMKNS